jgi:nitrous oxide reductase accessory protein NosL
MKEDVRGLARSSRLAGPTFALVAIHVLLTLLGCGPTNDRQATNAHEAVALADQEDEVCGMLVREQTAPRAQVVHVDGSRFFFCSLGDMLVHMSAPSPNGRAEAVFVEVMTAGQDPMQSHTGVHPWVRAESAVYVVGIERQRIMGAPVLAYANEAEAIRAMQGHAGARKLDSSGLRDWWKAKQAAR